MTHQREHLTTEDFAEREPVGQTPSDRDVAEPNLTDQERADREPVPYGEPAAHQRPADDPEHGYQGLDAHDEREAPVAQDDPVAHPVAQDDPAARDEQATGREPVELSAVDTTAGDTPLFTADDATDYQAEWRALQADFVDDPREAVQRADELVAQVMRTLATTFNEHKHALEEQWQRGDEVQTEELRQALKRYRTFFDRLLSV